MPRILTIDDSSTIRSIITKQMSDLGFEVDQSVIEKYRVR